MYYFEGNAARVISAPERPAAQRARALLDFFGLSAHPFAPTADPAYYYATTSHRECLFHLWNTIDARHGISVVLGNYGSGKTTLLRKLITGMRSQTGSYTTAVIASPIPTWTSFSLLEAIVTQFGITPRSRSYSVYMKSLYDYLISKRDSVTTLIIDDAQNLNKGGHLELLRLVQNLETPQHKLINLILFAQLEWRETLRGAPNFQQRVNTTYTIEPLNDIDIRNLIAFRLQQAGSGSRGPTFDDSAIRLICAFAEGSPRVTLTLCRNAMSLAFQVGVRHIGRAIVLHTIDKTTLLDPERRELFLPPPRPTEPVAFLELPGEPANVSVNPSLITA